MPLRIEPIDSRALFRPLGREFGELLITLDDAAWNRPTVARAWRVRDVVAHLLDTTLRRLSFHRDRHQPPPPDGPIRSDEDFVAFINGLNATWVSASQRLSPALLAQLFVFAADEYATFIEALPLEAPPLFPVSWAGADGDLGWLDISREFTEQWHHQMQVRDAVGGPPPSDPSWLNVVLRAAMCGLPHAYRAVDAPDGTALAIVVTGDAGGEWTLVRERGAWVLTQGVDAGGAAARCEMTDDTAWRLLFNALPAAELAAIRCSGDATLLATLLRARSVVV